MCGILGVVARGPVNQLLYDALLVLQHRGQDAAGIVTCEGASFHMHKGPGLVRDVFRTRNMRALVGHMGIAHARYPTAGSAWATRRRPDVSSAQVIGPAAAGVTATARIRASGVPGPTSPISRAVRP